MRTSDLPHETIRAYLPSNIFLYIFFPQPGQLMEELSVYAVIINTTI